MRRFELQIRRGRQVETRVMRANQIGSLVGMAQDMMKEDFSISNIVVTNLVTGEIEIVR